MSTTTQDVPESNESLTIVTLSLVPSSDVNLRNMAMQTSEHFHAQQWIKTFDLGNHKAFPLTASARRVAGILWCVQTKWKVYLLDLVLISHKQPRDATVEVFVVAGEQQETTPWECETTLICHNLPELQLFLLFSAGLSHFCSYYLRTFMKSRSYSLGIRVNFNSN